MVFLRSFAAGIIALVAYVVVLAVYPFVQMWWQVRRAGSGGIGVVFTTVGLLQFIVGLLIFAVAFWWQFRRAS